MSAVSLLRMWPDIAAPIAAEERGVAERALVAPLGWAHDEDLAAAFAATGGDAFNFVVVEGMAVKETTLAGRSALEVFGPGDVLAPPLSATRQLEARAVSRYVAHGDVSVAALGKRFRLVARRWPQIADFVDAQIAEQAHRTSMHLAALHLPRAEDRILALFAELGDRFGRVTPDGIRIELRLSHELIGRLSACRRSTVTLALNDLHRAGLLTRLSDKSWMLVSRPRPA